MKKRRSSRRNKPAKPLTSAKAAVPPPGLSYTREQDERPYRMKALHEEFPGEKCSQLARRYEARYGVSLTKNVATAALRHSGVRLQEKRSEEIAERPHRLAKLLSVMSYPTRDKLADAYEREHGIALPYEVISRTLRNMGIRLIEPARKPDRDEVEARGERLCELAEELPQLTHDQLGRKYEEIYGLRLPPSTVALAFKRLDVYRHRLTDLDELAERPERLKRLAESNPDSGIRELVNEYERLYDTNLHPVTVQITLNRLGIYRMLPVNTAEVAKRPARLRALVKKYPYMNCAQLAQEYGRRYKTIISKTSVENALRRIGGFRRRPTDMHEVKERSGRINLLRREHPRLNAVQLAEVYRERYGVTLHSTTVIDELNRLGIFRQRRSTPSEIKKRPQRLKALAKTHPLFTHEELAKEYERKYGHPLTPSLVTRALNSIGIFDHRNRTNSALSQRVERLKAIAAEHPEMNKKEIIEEFGRLYGEALNAHSTRALLRSKGVYLSRGEVTRQRVERLKAIATECPTLSKAGIVREYGRRYGEELKIKSTLATLRRLKVLRDQ